MKKLVLCSAASEKQRRQRILTITVITEVIFGAMMCAASIFVAPKLSPMQVFIAFGMFVAIYALPLFFVSNWAGKAPSPSGESD